MSAAADTSRRALIAGSTGLVGRALLARLERDARYGRIEALVRRPPPSGIAAAAKVHLHVVDFAALPTDLHAVDDAFIALGTTIRIAGSEAAFRAVDFDAVLAVAKAARAAGATRLAIVSALGADAASRVFYSRVKGEMEAAVSRLGFTTVVFARPSVLLGDRAALGQAPRITEAWAARLPRPVMNLVPRGWRPIAADDVAAALIAALADSAAGVRGLGSAEMQGARDRH